MGFGYINYFENQQEQFQQVLENSQNLPEVKDTVNQLEYLTSIGQSAFETGSLSRLKQFGASFGEKISKDEIEHRYGIKSDRDMTDKEAKLIYERKEREDEYNRIMQRGREQNYSDSLLDTGAEFVAGVLGTFADPVETTASIGIGMLTGGFGLYAKIGQSLGIASKISKMGMTGKVVFAATESAIESALMEIPKFATSETQMRDYTAEELTANVTLGAAFGGVAPLFGGLSKKHPEIAKHIEEKLEFEQLKKDAEVARMVENTPEAHAMADTVHKMENAKSSIPAVREKQVIDKIALRNSIDRSLELNQDAYNKFKELKSRGLSPDDIKKELSEFTSPKEGIEATGTEIDPASIDTAIVRMEEFDNLPPEKKVWYEHQQTDEMTLEDYRNRAEFTGRDKIELSPEETQIYDSVQKFDDNFDNMTPEQSEALFNGDLDEFAVKRGYDEAKTVEFMKTFRGMQDVIHSEKDLVRMKGDKTYFKELHNEQKLIPKESLEQITKSAMNARESADLDIKAAEEPVIEEIETNVSPDERVFLAHEEATRMVDAIAIHRPDDAKAINQAREQTLKEIKIMTALKDDPQLVQDTMLCMFTRSMS